MRITLPSRRCLVRRPALSVLPLLAVGLSGAATASAAPAATSAWPQPWASRIVTPAAGAVLTNPTVQVTAQLGPGVRKFYAWVGDARITGAYNGSGRLRDATLQPGRTPGLGYGRRTLYIKTTGASGKSWWAEQHVIIARAGTGLLGAVSVRRVPGAGADVTAATTSRSVRVSMQVDGGRRIGIPGAGRRHTLHLSGDQGLHPGVNLVVVRALDPERGRFQVRRVELDMPALTPVAGAGAEPSRTRTGVGVRLSAAGTRLARGTHARYRWAIVSRPAGSRARLQDATSMHPMLRPDRVGRYVLRLTVRGVHGGSKAQIADVTDSDSATTALEATPPTPGIGLPIDTIDGQGIVIGSTAYPAPSSSDALQMLVLSRSTLAEVSNTSYTNDDTGASALLAAVQALSNQDLVIIEKPISTTNNGSDATATATINKALAAIGVGSVAQGVANGATSCSTAVPCSVFSAIGVPGLPAGQGVLDAGLAQTQGHPWGDLHGFLQENLAGTDYQYVSTERVPFDTGSPTADPAVVTVGSNEAGSPFPLTTYTSQTLPSGTPGFYVLVLSAGNLATLGQGTYTDDANGLAQMHTFLAPYTTDQNALVIVRSIGAVTRVNTPAWVNLHSDIAALGGSSLYFDALSSTGSSMYAQVGPGGWPAAYPSQWTQVATVQRTDSGELTGLLARDPLDQLYPDESVPADVESSGTPLTGTIAGLISLPPSAWPEASYDQGENLVLSCIDDYVIDDDGTKNTITSANYPTIQSQYLNENVNWTNYARTLESTGFFKSLSSWPGCTNIKQQDFTPVQTQLNAEWTAVPNVISLFTKLNTDINNSPTAVSEIVQVAQNIDTSVAPPSTNVHYDGYALASDALWALSTIPPADVVADPLNFLAATLGLADSLNTASDGSATATVNVAAAKLATSLAGQLTTATGYLAREETIILQDWTKLQIASDNSQDDGNAAADWSWQPSDGYNAATGLMLSVRRTAYEALFPTVYPLYRLQEGTAPLGDAKDYSCAAYDPTGGLFAPFWTVPANAWTFVGTNAADTEDWVFARTSVNWTSGNGYMSTTYPSNVLLTAMFGEATAGQPQTALFNQLEFGIEAYDNATTNVTTVTRVNGKHYVKSSYFCQVTTH